jgi:hypothetical protein
MSVRKTRLSRPHTSPDDTHGQIDRRATQTRAWRRCIAPICAISMCDHQVHMHPMFGRKKDYEELHAPHELTTYEKILRCYFFKKYFPAKNAWHRHDRSWPPNSLLLREGCNRYDQILACLGIRETCDEGTTLRHRARHMASSH